MEAKLLIYYIMHQSKLMYDVGICSAYKWQSIRRRIKPADKIYIVQSTYIAKTGSQFNITCINSNY